MELEGRGGLDGTGLREKGTADRACPPRRRPSLPPAFAQDDAKSEGSGRRPNCAPSSQGRPPDEAEPDGLAYPKRVTASPIPTFQKSGHSLCLDKRPLAAREAPYDRARAP